MRRSDLTPRVLAMMLAAALSFTSVPVISYAQEETTSIALENGALEETQAQPVETQPTEAETQNTEAQPTEAETQNTETQPQETESSSSASETQPAETQTVEEPQTTETEPEVPQTTQIEESETPEAEATSEAEPESPSVIDIAKKAGRDQAEAIISNAKKNVANVLSTLAEVIPGGEYIKSFFDLLTGVLGDDIIGNTDDDADLSSVIEKLEEIQTTLSSVAEDVKELKNETFYVAINEIHRISGLYIGRLTAYNKAVKALKDAPATTSEEDRINLQGAVLGTRESLKRLAEKTDISETLRTNLTIAIQYMSNDTSGKAGQNPFLIYLEAKKKSPNIRYGSELLEVQHQFDKTVWTFFVEGLSLYTACMEINASFADNKDTMLDIAESLAEVLTGSTDGSDSYMGRSILNAIKFYNTEVRQKEDEVIGNYQPKIGDVSSFKVLTNVKTLNYGNQLEPTDGSYNTEALMYLTNFQSNDYKGYLKKLNEMINDEYLAKYSKLKLRTFLTDKLGITVPEQSKYLILSEIRFSYGNYINVIPLDETNTSVQMLRITDQDYDNLCFFSASVSQKDDSAAAVYFSDKGTSFNFDTFEEAWNFACSYQSNTTITLYKDVIAKKEGDEEFTRFGTGSNFTAEENGETVYGALYVRGNITIDLNNHTINRNQDIAVAGGSVFLMDSYSTLTLKNGTVTGGNTTGNGGVVNSHDLNTRVTFDHMTLTNNHADGYGGAVYYGNGIDYDLIDTTITENTAGKNGGGIYCRSYQGLITADIVVKGVIIIRDNTVNGQPNNATLTDQPTKKTIFKLDKSFSGQSWIGVNTTSTDKWIDITDGSIRALACDTSFHCDRSDQTKECYRGHFTREWYICIYTNQK